VLRLARNGNFDLIFDWCSAQIPIYFIAALSMNNMTHVLKVLTLFVLAASLLGDVSADTCVIPSTYVGLEKRVFASVDTYEKNIKIIQY
jgi:hypothetical protein